MKTLKSLTALLALLAAASPARATTTTVPLNTGYDHSIFGPYATPPSNPSMTRDQYWLNIASYPTATPTADLAYVIRRDPINWALPMLASNWVSARNTYASASIATPANPTYTIFRKCFCLSEGYRNAKLSFDVRSDDSVQVWLNTQLNSVLPPTPAIYWASSTHAETTSGFRVGRNCLYVLVEDTIGNGGGSMGFDMVGDISADGLLPTPAKGLEQTFGQCSCGMK